MKLQLDARARRWIRRLPRVNVYSMAELVLLAALAIQLARLFWAVVTPVSPLGDWRPAEVALPAAPADTLAAFDPFFRTGPAAAGPATVTALAVHLFGTRIDDATGRGSAIIAGADNVQQSVSVGDEVAPGVKLKAVFFDHVTLDRGGTDEDLFLDQSGGQPGVSTPGIDPGVGPGGLAPPLSAIPPNGIAPAALRSDVGYIPRIEGGRLSGLTVRPQGPGAAFRAAGLQEGDVLTAIGGRPVSGAGDLDRLQRDFAAGGNVSLTVERGGRPVPLNITLSGASK